MNIRRIKIPVSLPAGATANGKFWTRIQTIEIELVPSLPAGRPFSTDSGRLVKALAKGPLTYLRLREEVGIPASTFRRHLAAAVAGGKIQHRDRLYMVKV